MMKYFTPSYCFVLAMLVSMLTFGAVRVQAQTVEDGTEAHPYLIESKQELLDFSRCMHPGSQFYFNGHTFVPTCTGDSCKAIPVGGEGTYFLLTTNIVMNEGDVAGSDGEMQAGWTKWVPMQSFNGVFDGGYHTISGLFSDTIMAQMGLFTSVSGAAAAIKNIGITNSYFRGQANVGGIVGEVLDNATVSHCFFEGTLSCTLGSGNNMCGGIASLVTLGTVTDCYSAGRIYAKGSSYEIGGVVGRLKSGTLSKCYTTVVIMGGDIYTGSVCGRDDNNGVLNCHYDRQMTDMSGTIDGVAFHLTAEMTSSTWTALGSAFVPQDGFYPYLSGFDFAGNPDVRLSVIPIFLRANSSSDYETMADLHTDFLVGTTPGASWSATSWNNCVTVDNATLMVHLAKQGIANLVVTLNGHSRTYILYPNVEPYIGSEQNAFTIDNLAELKQFRDGINGGEDFIYKRFPVTYTNLPNIHWLQTHDINMDSVPNWTPVGNNSRPFTGYYHGGGNRISKIKTTSGTTDYKGLFGYVSNAYIENLDLDSIDINSSGYVGGLCGYAKNTIVSHVNIINSSVKGTSTSSSFWVGGICGYMDNSQISYCENVLTTVTSGFYSGGVVGNLIHSNLTQCKNSGNVYNTHSSANEPDAGGIAACLSYGTVSFCLNTGNVQTVDCGGGIVARLRGNATVFNCINIGEIYTKNACSSPIGGIVGYQNAANDKIEGCINTGKVNGKSNSIEGAGGIIGYGPSGTSITHCYNAGFVIQEPNMYEGAGGITTRAGSSSYCLNISPVSVLDLNYGYPISNASVSNSFYDNQISLDFTKGTNLGRKTSELIGETSIFSNAVTNQYWLFKEGMYPRLAWTDSVSWARNIAIAACTPVLLATDEENVDNVKNNFRIFGCDSNVTWKVMPLATGQTLGGCLFRDFAPGDVLSGTCTNNAITPELKDVCMGPTTIGAYVGDTLVKLVTLRRYVKPIKDTLTIASRADLVELQTGVNTGEAFFYHDTLLPRFADSIWFRVVADIPMTSTTWTPIGNSTQKPFKGNIIGEGHIISGLTTTAGTAGLFGKMVNSRVSDLHFTGVNLSSGSTKGALCGHLANGEVINCSVSGSISGGGNNGGLVGQTTTKATFVNCSANISISAGDYNGGLVGSASTLASFTNCTANVNITAGSRKGGIVGSSPSTTIRNCMVTGSISGGSEYTGGIVGYIDGGRIVNCTNWAAVSCTSSNGKCGGIAGQVNSNCGVSVDSCVNRANVTGGQYAGGITGAYGVINYCYNTGDITGKGTCTHTGGISGGGTCCVINYCYNVGAITAEPGNSTTGSYVGGIAGSGAANYCYNAGQVFGNNRMYVGGIIGYLNGSVAYCYNSNTVRSTGTYLGSIAGDTRGYTVVDNYYDNQLNTASAFSNIADAGSKGEGKPTESMLGSALSSLGSNTIWSYQDNLYPQLQCFAGVSPSVSSVMPVSLTNNETWNHVHSPFYMHGCQLGHFTIMQGNCLSLDTAGHLCQMQLAGPAMGVAQVGAAVSDTVYRIVRLLVNIEAPLIIKNKMELCNFRDVINAGHGYYKLSDQTYKLALASGDNVGDFMEIEDGGLDLTFSFTATDADFSTEASSWTWTPVGNSNIKFQGDFMGNNRTISGLKLAAGDYRGLFGWVYSSHIDNLTLTNAVMTGGSSHKGILCGRNTGGVFDNCVLENSSVSGASAYTGLLCGTNEYGTIKNCHTWNCILAATGERVGGVVGYSQYAKIDSCYSDNLTVTGGGSYKGGIVGYNYRGYVYHCQIMNSNINVSGGESGGICGRNHSEDAANPAIIRYCANINCSMTSSSSQFGGIVGRIYHINSQVLDCYTTGGSVNSTANDSWVGGICGYMHYHQNNGTLIRNCYNENPVTGKSFVGGIAGVSREGLIDSCYNLADVTGTGNYVGGIVGDNRYASTVRQTYNAGNVTSKGNYVGGIAGGGSETATSIVNCCYNIGMVQGNNRVGGICGYVNDNHNVTYSYNAGIVRGVSQVGGIMGTVGNSSNVSQYNYNIGWVDGSSMMGAVCGYTPNYSKLSNNYYDMQMSHYKGIMNEDVADKAIPMLTTEMLGNGLSALGTGNTYWVFQEGMYPRLKKWANTDAAVASAIPVLLGEDAYGPVEARDIPHGTYKLGGADTVEWVRYEGYGVTIDNAADTFGVNSRGRVQIANVINGDTLKVVQLVLGVSEEHPLEIVSKEQFLVFRDFINSGATFYYNPETQLFLPADSAGTYIEIEPYGARMFFKLTCDVNLALDAGDWTPIGAYSSSEPEKKFKGHFNGDGHTVKGMRIAGGGKPYQGLFGYLQGTVKDLNVEKPEITCDGDYHGAIAGYNYGTVVNCHSYGGTVGGSNYVGGLVGKNSYDQMSDCSSGNNVSGSTYVGGIAGACTDAGIVTRCFNYGMVSATALNSYVGGLTGSTAVEVSYSYNTGAVSGHTYTGGIAGYSTTTLVRYCYNAAWVTSDKTVNVGAVTTGTNPTSCYYDSQLCPDFEGLGTSSGSTNSGCTKLYTEKMTSGSTSDMSGLGTSNWTFTAGEYPRLTTMAGLDASIVSVKPVFLTKGTNHMLVNKVAEPFTVQQGESVVWGRYGGGRALDISNIDAGKVGLEVCGEDTLRVSLNNTYRLVPVSVYELGSEWLVDTVCTGYYVWAETGRIYTTSTKVEAYVPVGEDGLGCNRVVRLDLTIPPQLDVDVTVQNRSCHGSADDYITATVTGGFGQGYLYFWIDGSGDTVLQGVTSGVTTLNTPGPGNYRLSVYDKVFPKCEITWDGTVTEPAALSCRVTESDSRCWSVDDGFVTVDYDGGTIPYDMYVLDGTAAVDSVKGVLLAGTHIFGSLPDGTYTVRVVDGNGCSADSTVAIAGDDAEYNITAKGVNKMYDGAEVKLDSFRLRIGGTFDTVMVSGGSKTLANGDVLTATVRNTATVKDVTTQTNGIAALSIMRGSEDVSCRYHRTGYESDVDVVISKRDVVLTSADSSMEVAATAEPRLCKHQVTVGGDGFASGEDTASIVYLSSLPGNAVNITDNAFDYTLKSNTLAGNYNITKVYGKLVVHSGIVVRTDGATRKYDGTALTAPGYMVIGKFGDGDTVKVEMAGSSVTDCGWVLNDTASVRFVRKSDMSTPAAGSYQLEALILDTLRILPREVSLTTAGATKVYDGTPLTQTTVTVGGDGFVAGEASCLANTSITNVGSVTDTIKLTKNAGYKDTNYRITFSEGTLTVTPRPLTITGETRTLAYNGNLQTITGVSTNLLSGHTLSGVSYSASGKEPRTTPYPGSFADTTGVISVKDDGGREVKDNYSITLVPGSLTISGNPLPILITSNDGSHKYDYTLYNYYNYTVLYNGTSINAVQDTLFPLGNGDTLVVRPVGTGLGITHVVENGPNDFDYYVKNAANEDVTGHYSDITAVKGSLTIIPRMITLKSHEYNEVYTGKNVPLQIDGIDNIIRGGDNGSDDGFVSMLGHSEGVTCTLLTQESQVGKYVNNFSYTANAVTDINDYDIHMIRDTIRIVPAVLMLTVTDTARYYGEENPVFGYTLSGLVCNVVNSVLECEDTCATGGTCAAPFLTDARPVLGTVATAASPAGEYAITADITGVALANYRIEVNPGILKVRPRVVTIEAFSLAERVYNGQEHSWSETTAPHYQVTGSGLMAGDTVISVIISGSRKLAGVTPITLNNAIVKHFTAANHDDPSQWEDVTQSYAPNYVNGSITIVPDTITLKPYPFTHVFTGHNYTSDSTAAPHYSVTPAGALALNNDKIVAVTINGSRASVGKSVFEIDAPSIRIVSAVAMEADYDNPAYNTTGGYFIKLDTALLEVTHRTDKYDIELHGRGDTLVYNGNEQSVNGIVENLFEFEGFQYRVEGVYSTATSTDTGNTATTFSGLTGPDSTVRVYSVLTGENMTDEFNITAVPGNLRIIPRPITVTAKGVNVQYDGLEHSYTDNLTPYETDNLCAGERVSAYTMTGARTLPGREEIHVDPSSIRIQHISPSRDVTSNYIISTVDSAIHITDRTEPYAYILKAKGDTIAYDGNPHQLTGFDTLRFAVKVRTSGGEYVDVIYHIDPLSVQAATVADASDTGNYVNTASFTGMYQLNGRDTARVLDASNVDVSKQFAVTLANNNFRIKQRPVVFTANSLTREYDGNTYTYTHTTAPYWTADNLLTGHTAEVTFQCAGQTTVGSTPVFITGVIIKDASDNDVTRFYDTSYVAGAITIIRNSTMTVDVPGTNTYVYDGDPHSIETPVPSVDDGYTVVYYSTVDPSSPGFDPSSWSTTNPAITHVDEGPITVYVMVVNPNYDTAYTSVPLTITRRPVTIQVTGTYGKTYGEADPSFADAHILNAVGTELQGIDTTVIRTNSTVNDAGVYEKVLTITKGKDELEALYKDYSFTVDSISFTIQLSNDMTITLPLVQEKTYDAVSLDATCTATSNPSGTITLTYYTSDSETGPWTLSSTVPVITDVGTLYVKVTASQPNFNNVDSIFSLKVNPRTVTLQSFDSTRYYNGLPLSYDSVKVTGDIVYDTDASEYEMYNFHAVGSIDVLGSVPNVIRFDSTTHFKRSNYNLVFDLGTLTISGTNAKIEVHSMGDTVPYDGTLHKREVYSVKFGDVYVTPDVTGRKFELLAGDTLTIEPLFAGITHVSENSDKNNTFRYSIGNDAAYVGVRDTTIGTVKIVPNGNVVVTVTGHTGEFNFDGATHHVGGYDVVLTDSLNIYTVSDFHFTGDSTIDESAKGTYPMNLAPAQFVNDNTDYDPVTFNVTDGRMVIFDTLVVADVTTENVSCKSAGDGKAQILVAGGKRLTSPYYNYTVTGVNTAGNYTGTTDDIISLTGLSPDTYNVTVTDELHYTATATFVIGEPDTLVAAARAQTNLCPMQTVYEVKATVAGGNGSYHYSWGIDADDVDDTVTTVTRTLADDGEHTYKVSFRVVDAKGCEAFDTLLFVTSPYINISNTTLESPFDMVVVLAYGRCDTVLNIGDAQLTSSLTGMPIVVTNDAPAGNRFQEGATKVVWTATDTCGFTVTDTQTVVVSYPPCGVGHDVNYDGFTYHTVRVGCECWLQENLRSTSYADGSPRRRGLAQLDPARGPVSMVYDDDPSNEESFGRLYTWYSAVRVPEGDDSAVPADSVAPMGERYVKGICPDGWALPTSAQFDDLWLNGYGVDGVKDLDSRYWLPGHAGTMPNCYFNARGAGFYDSDVDRYCNLLGETYFWTGEPSTTVTKGKCSVITHSCPEIVSQEQPKGRGQSVRCVEKK